jgi:hypothetical protein
MGGKLANIREAALFAANVRRCGTVFVSAGDSKHRNLAIPTFPNFR